ncbi:MAG: hypothetical protein KAG26_03380, partial [Methylococcales bacterium]|nr:hypothetical protein [Methylococcales bacterium]
GVADIEFMVQFGVLSQSNGYLELTKPRDNVHLIEVLKQHDFFTKAQAHALTTIYCEYRDYGHRQVLQGDKVLADTNIFSKQREIVQTIWTTLMLSAEQ